MSETYPTDEQIQMIANIAYEVIWQSAPKKQTVQYIQDVTCAVYHLHILRSESLGKTDTVADSVRRVLAMLAADSEAECG